MQKIISDCAVKIALMFHQDKWMITQLQDKDKQKLLASIVSCLILLIVSIFSILLLPLLFPVLFLISSVAVILIYYYAGKVYSKKYSLPALIIVILLTILGGVWPIIFILIGVYKGEKTKPENERKVTNSFGKIIGALIIFLGLLAIFGAHKSIKRTRKKW